MSLEVTVSVPSFPKPEADIQYRQRRAEDTSDDNQPILKAESYDAIDGYGIAGGDMRPGASWTFNAKKDFILRMLYLREERSEYPLFVYMHPRNEGRVHIAWVLPDGSERGVNMLPGTTVDLRDVWADGWIIEAKHGG